MRRRSPARRRRRRGPGRGDGAALARNGTPARRRATMTRGTGRSLGFLVAALAALGLASAGAATPGMTILYARRDAARAINDGAPGLPGVHDTWRQAPIFDDARWPAGRQVAKVGGDELAPLDAGRMAAVLRAGLRDPKAGGRVAVDELNAGAWDGAALGELRQALGQLGPDAARVVVYLGPGLVSQVGRRDPRLALAPRLAALLEALRPAGGVFLSMYHGGGRPFSRTEM